MLNFWNFEHCKVRSLDIWKVWNFEPLKPWHFFEALKLWNFAALRLWSFETGRWISTNKPKSKDFMYMCMSKWCIPWSKYLCMYVHHNSMYVCMCVYLQSMYVCMYISGLYVFVYVCMSDFRVFMYKATFMFMNCLCISSLKNYVFPGRHFWSKFLL